MRSTRYDVLPEGVFHTKRLFRAFGFLCLFLSVCLLVSPAARCLSRRDTRSIVCTANLPMNELFLFSYHCRVFVSSCHFSCVVFRRRSFVDFAAPSDRWCAWRRPCWSRAGSTTLTYTSTCCPPATTLTAICSPRGIRRRCRAL